MNSAIVFIAIVGGLAIMVGLRKVVLAGIDLFIVFDVLSSMP